MRALVFLYIFSLFLIVTAPRPPDHQPQANSGLHETPGSETSSVATQDSNESQVSNNEYEGGDEKDVKKQGHPDYLVCDGKVWSPNSHNLAEKHPEQSHEPILISYEIRVSKMTRNPWYGRDGLKFKKRRSYPNLKPPHTLSQENFTFTSKKKSSSDMKETHQLVEDLLRQDFSIDASKSIVRNDPYENRKWCRDDPDYKQQDPVLALAPPKSKSKSQKHTLEEVDKGHEDPEEPKKRLKMSNG